MPTNPTLKILDYYGCAYTAKQTEIWNATALSCWANKPKKLLDLALHLGTILTQ